VLVPLTMECVERSGKTASIFEPYRRDGLFIASEMSADEMLSLMLKLCAIRFERHYLV